jgi:predicted O-linked N-acetylglucosamine transferase (SPINDLY family)
MKLCDWGGIEEKFEKVLTKRIHDSNKIHPFHLLPFLDDPFLIKDYTDEYVSDEFPPNTELGDFPTKEGQKKIRIGYFSADFKNHPVSFLIAGMLEEHDKSNFELFGFSSYMGQPDEMTLRVGNSFDQFFDVTMKSDRAIAELSRELEIDIAVDLGGITQDARLEVFSYRAAPIQISYIGYLGTLAVPYIDYIIADETIIPAELQKAYSEKIIYLTSYQANDPKKVISNRVFTRDELGLPKEGFVYCCFNNNYKFTPSIFNSWAKILKQVEGSVLLLYAESETVKINLSKEIEVRGIDSSRLIFGGKMPREDYLARYRIADLFLDTSPYNAGATASDALWAGLPVLTFLGRSFSARMCGSLLRAIGLSELVASSQREYEELAIDIGRNPRKISELKNKLANNRLSKPLFDLKLFTQNIELAYLKAYERNKLALPLGHIY